MKSDRDEEQAKTIMQLRERGILQEGGHYVYSRGEHGPDYVDKNALMANIDLCDELVETLAQRLASRGIEAIVGPMTGGALLARDFARVLSRLEGRTVFPAFTEKHPITGATILGRNFDKIVRGRKVAMIEDVVNTAESLLAACKAVMLAGGTVVVLGMFWNRGPHDTFKIDGEHLLFPTEALVRHKLVAYDAKTCPLRGRKINLDLGHGATFLAKNKEHV